MLTLGNIVGKDRDSLTRRGGRDEGQMSRSKVTWRIIGGLVAPLADRSLVIF